MVKGSAQISCFIGQPVTIGKSKLIGVFHSTAVYISPLNQRYVRSICKKNKQTNACCLWKTFVGYLISILFISLVFIASFAQTASLYTDMKNPTYGRIHRSDQLFYDRYRLRASAFASRSAFVKAITSRLELNAPKLTLTAPPSGTPSFLCASGAQ